jgi:hypothetical protein
MAFGPYLARNKTIGRGVNAIVRLVQISFLSAVSLVSATVASAQTALQLFHEMQLALGGAKKISAIRDFDETVRAETWDSQGRPLGIVRKRVRWIRPNYLRIDQSGSYDTYILFFDGRAGWEIMPDKSVRDLSGGELTFVQNYLHGLDFNVWLADRDPGTIFSSPATHIIVIAPGGDKSRAITVTVDPVTHLPIKQGSTSHSDPSHPVPACTIPDEWRTINGVKFPGRIRNFHEGRMLAEITVEAMQVNLGMNSGALSIKPADLRPVISGS